MLQQILFQVEAQATAEFSPCRTHRYTLWRRWSEGDNYVQFIGLNPSTADEFTNDPTLRRCIDFARTWGYPAMCMTNLFSFRATDPNDMKAAEKPNGEENDRWIKQVADGAQLVIAAWGIHGVHRGRDLAVKNLLTSRLFCLGTTKAGAPLHPLYLKKTTVPHPFL